jgi:hypothetical protein
VPKISTTTLPPATAGRVYLATLAATGSAPIHWRISAGSLPAGLSLDSAAGMIIGTPLRSGVYSFTVLATNSAGAASRFYKLRVGAPRT